MTYTTRFDDAVALAVDSFRDIVRKETTIPYITHLFSVCATVGEHGGDEDQMIAAMLHDLLEDVEGTSAEQLEARFGARVARLVVALSDTTLRPKPPWRQRKERYLEHLAGEDPEVKLISAADKLHNCLSIRRDLRLFGATTFNRFTGGRDGTLWYYEQVAVALGRGWEHPLLDELVENVGALVRDGLTAR